MVGCESGIYVAPVESNGAHFFYHSFFFEVYLWIRKNSDGISIDIELYASHLDSGTDNAWAEDV